MFSLSYYKTDFVNFGDVLNEIFNTQKKFKKIKDIVSKKFFNYKTLFFIFLQKIIFLLK